MRHSGRNRITIRMNRGPARRQLLGAALIGASGAALAACSGGSKSGSASGGSGKGADGESEKPGAADILKAAKDQASLVDGIETAEIGKVLGGTVTVPRIPSARGLSEAIDIALNKAIREQAMRGADGIPTVTGRVILAAPGHLGALLEVKDDEGAWPATIFYDAKGDIARTSPALIEAGQWKAFVKAVADAAEKNGADRGTVEKLCQEQPRPWGNGPTLLPAADGAVHALFPTLDEASQLVTLDKETAAKLLSKFGQQLSEAAAKPTAFDAKSVSVPDPGEHDGDHAYEKPLEVWQAQPARESKGPGPRTQLAPLAEEGTAPSDVAAPDATRLKTVALTFDDGPSPELNKKLRGDLKEKGAAATFFMIGQSIASFTSHCTDTAKDGFEIGSHSWSHPPLSRCSDGKLDKELGNTTDELAKATGRKPFVMRPPYGDRSKRVDDAIGKVGQSVQLWDVDSQDWRHKNVEKNLGEIKQATRRGSIVLMHEIHPTSVQTVPQALDWFGQEGFTLLTCSELGQNQMRAGKHYTHGAVTVDERHPEPAPSDGGGATEPGGGN